MEITSSLSYGPTPSPYEKALVDTVQKLDNTLNSLKLNHPGLTDKVENIKQYINASLKAQQELDDYECENPYTCLLYTSPSPRDRQKSRMPSSA